MRLHLLACLACLAACASSPPPAVAFDATPARGDTSATAGRVLPALARVPRYFLLGMWTLTPR